MSGRFLGKKLSSFQIIIVGFVGLILIGALLLTLPVSVGNGASPSFGTALFTSTSAVCVTGLVVQDTASHWSVFGQAVILLLIQIGGLGVVSVSALIAILSGRRISLLQRSMLQDSISAHQIGGTVRMTAFIFRSALIIETAGALLMLPAFCGRYGGAGIWMSFFHSVSAFCNAGFDLTGSRTGAFSSLTQFSTDLWVVIPVCLLILIGGIGYLTWDDIVENRFHLRRYRLQSKAILACAAVLILLPALYLFFFEYGALPLRERICLSLFQAVTPRTAGFNTASMTSLSGSGRILMISLMLIGGAPGSTAGGMKTTTVAVLFANAFSVFRRRKNAQLFGRRIEDGTVKSAASLLSLYLFLTAAGAAVISAAEHLPAGVCLFETASAIGTVGLSMGITPSLSLLSRLVLIALMFFGRVGGLTLMYAALSGRNSDVSMRPIEKIAVG